MTYDLLDAESATAAVARLEEQRDTVTSTRRAGVDELVMDLAARCTWG